MGRALKNFIYPRIFAFCIAALCLGVAVGYVLQPPLKPMLIAAVVVLIGSLFALRRRIRFVLLLFAFCAGVLLIGIDEAAYRPFPVGAGESVNIYGKVVEKVLISPNDETATFTVKPQYVDGADYNYGRIKVYCKPDAQPGLGDTVVIAGEVMEPFGRGNSNSFDYADYLRQNNITACISTLDMDSAVHVAADNKHIFWTLIDSMRDKMNELINRLQPDTAAAVKGVVLGDKSDLPYTQEEDYIQSGILHAFAVSGMHITFVLVFSTIAFSFLRPRKWLYLLCNSLVLVFYSCFMGLNPSVWRSLIMAEAALFAFVLGERNDSYTAIAAAALFCLLYRPLWLFNAGFQLSFVTVFFMIYLYDSFEDTFRFLGRFAPALITSVSAGLAAMPLVAYYFYIISPISFIFSPLAVVLVDACVAWGVCAMLLVFLLPLGAYIFIYASGAVLTLLAAVTHWLTDVSGSFLLVNKPAIWLIVLYFAIMLMLPRIKRHFGKIGLFIACLLIAVGMPLFSSDNTTAAYPEGDNLEVCFLDVGQGDCTYIRTPDGKHILIDGGGEGDSGDIGEYVLMPYLKSRGVGKIDLMISTHPDFDHRDGLLTVLDNMPVEYCAVTGAPQVDNYSIEKAARRNDTVLLYAVEGHSIQVGKDITVDVLFPYENYSGETENDTSIVCRISYGEHSFLFTGDVGYDGIDTIIDSELEATVVKVPHHGSFYNFDAFMYESLDARYAVISCGLDNPYGHPHREVMEYFTKERITVYRTDTQGEIRFVTNGKELYIDTYK